MLAYTRPRQCTVCSSPVECSLQRVTDRVYATPGEWNFVRCVRPDCAVIYLDHDLTTAQLAGFYANYGTHAAPVLNATGVKRFYRDTLAVIQQRRLGYSGKASTLSRVAAAVLARLPFFRENALSRLFWLPARHHGRVLEVGFGNAQSLIQLREAGWEVVGCEFDDRCVAQARMLGIEVVQGGLPDADFPADSFDAVVASHTIEHVPDPISFVREAARILKPGGRLILLTPNAASRDARRYGRDWRGLEVPRHLSIHTPGSLRLMAQAAGFAAIEVSGTPLGGFIDQQTREIASGAKPSRRQSLKTVLYNLRAHVTYVRQHLDSEEIVARCQMSG